MNSKKPPQDASALRHRAEQRLADVPIPSDAADVQKLLHELQVHQIELEMQNEALRGARDALEITSRRYADLYDFAPISYFTLAQDGTVHHANLAASALLGKNRISIVGRRMGLFFNEKSRPIFNNLLETAFKTGDKQAGEMTLLVNGQLLWVAAQASVEPERASCLFTLQDIDGSKKAELALAQSEAKHDKEQRFLRLMIDTLPDLIWIKDVNGVFLDCNRRFELMFGVPKKDIVGKTDFDFVGEELANIFQTHDRLVIQTRHTQTNEEPVIFASDGHGEWLETTKSPMFDAQGKLMGVLGFGHNTTERKIAREALAKSEADFRLLAESMPHIVWGTSADGRNNYFNQQWMDYTGLTLDESYGDGWLEPFHPDDRQTAWDAWQNAVKNQGSYSLKCRLRRADGVYRWWLVSGVPALDENNQILKWFGTCTDIDEIHRTEQELISHKTQLQVLVASRTADLEIAKAAAEAANNAKSRFLAAASHDLRQPLAAMSLYVEVLKIKMNPPDEKLLGNMTACVSSLSELLTDLLDISKLDAGVVTPELSDFSVSDLLQQLIAVYAPQALAKGLRLRCRTSTVRAYTDRVWMARMLSNLIANAVRYTHNGGALVACRQHQGRTWVEVWDSGVGIPADKTEVIFEEYRQLRSGTHELHSATDRVGSGLGLAIVAKTAALLRLKIRVKSQVGRGSMFAVELPLGMANRVVEHQEVKLKPLRIAFVDDNALMLDALVSALEGKGNLVVAASSGQELLDLLGQKAPDVVICDYRLANGETGFDVIAAVRKLFGANLPALLITGDTDPEILRNMTAQGISVQHKPLKFEDLLAEIANLVKQSALQRCKPI